MANDKTSALKEEIWNEYLSKHHTTKQLIDIAIRKTQEADKKIIKDLEERNIGNIKGFNKRIDELQSKIIRKVEEMIDNFQQEHKKICTRHCDLPFIDIKEELKRL